MEWILEAFLVGLICGIGGAVMLNRYGRSVAGFFLGAFLGPLGLIIAWVMRDNAKTDELLRSKETKTNSSSIFK